MPDAPQPAGFRFGVFEADAATGELRKQGVRIKLNVQPFQVLLMLLSRPGELLTRDEIARELWPEGTFVDYDHGVNSAINRIRDALGDTARNPRFVETLARRGYRFVAPVQVLSNPASAVAAAMNETYFEAPQGELQAATFEAGAPLSRLLAGPEDLPHASHGTVQVLFLLLQAMYLGFYVGALANLAEIRDLLGFLSHPDDLFALLVVTAALLIPVRIFVFCACVFHPPGARRKLLRIWPFLLGCDILWSLAPFLLLHHMSFGLALACVAPLVYSPFAQRSLVLMGAAESNAA